MSSSIVSSFVYLLALTFIVQTAFEADPLFHFFPLEKKTNTIYISQLQTHSRYWKKKRNGNLKKANLALGLGIAYWCGGPTL
ncbi:hypothetical protein ES319_D02G142900v1 [Gossypium barbadense]|uniref:Uncharacterized protein n=1 Tax=Gossypium barbadense TaxID=3634 RepID=A0A5J5SHG1_GOSBA|nr:hypothetical protein ES319_D02G142900v1 [Gossypium barbadense]